jgi:hypothetical protein
MKFLALITTFFLFLSPVTALSAEEVETEETPVVETVEEEEEEVIPGFTEEQLDKAISDWFANATEQTVEFSMSL